MIYDFHCDTLTKVLNNNVHIDYSDLKRSDIAMQVFAVFIDPSYQNYVQKALEMIDCFYDELSLNDRLMMVKNSSDIDMAQSKSKIACMLSIEGGEAIAGSLKLLKIYYKLGVRAMTLTWNGRNEICDGIGTEEGLGLTEFGREVIAAMDELHMLIDVSHISTKGFYDVLNSTGSPVIASHSNCKTICKHKRNLDDNQMKLLSDHGGVIGITYADIFLNDNKDEATIDDIVLNIKHAVNIMGIDHVALGSDFDGCNFPKDFRLNNLPLLVQKLEKLYNDDELDNILYKNWYRIIKDTLI